MITEQTNTTTTTTPTTFRSNRGINFNTLLIIVLAIAGYWYINRNDKEDSTVIAEVITKDEAIALSEMFAQGVPILKTNLYTTDVHLGNAVENFSLIYFQDLSLPARQWLESARVRIGTAIGSQDLKQSKSLTDKDRSNVIELFKKLSKEAESLAE